MILIVSRIQMRSADTKAVVKGGHCLLCDRRIDFAVCAIMTHSVAATVEPAAALLVRRMDRYLHALPRSLLAGVDGRLT
jgi:hypothetical protein